MRARCFCQCHGLFFVLLGVSILVTACRPRQPQRYSLLELQLLEEALDRLGSDRSAAARKPLERLRDSLPDQSFPVSALAHENERLAVLQLNQILARGDVGAGAGLVEEWAASGRAPALLPEARRLVRAIAALQAYCARIPFRDSETATAALATLRPHRSILRRGSKFELWLAARDAAVQALRAAEKAATLRQLWYDYDLAVVDESRDPALLLAEIESLEPEHSGLGAVKLAGRADWAEFQALATAAMPDANSLAGIEAAICVWWPAIPAAVRRGLRAALLRQGPQSLAGVLAHCLLGAVMTEPGTESPGAVAALAPFGRSRVRDLLEQRVLPPHQFRAGCWRSPVPAVSDILQRISQLREREFRRTEP